MNCFVKEITIEEENRNGEAKEILIDSYSWMDNEESGISYTYHLSKEKFERKIKKAYEIYLEGHDKDNINKTIKILVAIMHYYDFADYLIGDCIGEQKIESIATQLQHTREEVLCYLLQQLEPLKYRIEDEFTKTEEYKKKIEHQHILKRYNEAKKEFSKMYGVNAKNYDRCYDVFGRLMNSSYLNIIIARSKEREEFHYNSKNFRKKSYQYYSNISSITSDYDESEKLILEKFYKTLAKKYHPDANPNLDTSQEMTLINQLKHDWGV